MIRIHPQKCLLCRSKDYKVIFSYNEPDDYEKVIGVTKRGYARKWVQCKRCGFYYSVYSRAEKAMDKVYIDYRGEGQAWRREGSAEEVFRKVIALPEQESVTKCRIRWIKENILDLLEGGVIKWKSPPYKLLDVGGGTGVFAYEFQDRNWKSYVIDPNKDSIFIQEKLHIPLVLDFYKPNLFPYKFDLVSLIYTLEHLSDPIFVLKGLRKDMKKDGLLFIEVPDAIYFRYRPKTDEIFHSEHLWMFSPNTLNMFLESHGFEIFCLKRLRTQRDHYVIMVLAGKKYD